MPRVKVLMKAGVLSPVHLAPPRSQVPLLDIRLSRQGLRGAVYAPSSGGGPTQRRALFVPSRPLWIAMLWAKTPDKNQLST